MRLVKVIDTHIHADHISGIAELRDKTKCITIMGEHAPGDVVSMSVKDNESVSIEKIHLKALLSLKSFHLQNFMKQKTIIKILKLEILIIPM